ncbi:MAG: hypothetical protein ISS47_01600 [Candidatus Omnitrophica bacterium]|nr:hypothetical protein [Candidatus Omnitrophota bacterium]
MMKKLFIGLVITSLTLLTIGIILWDAPVLAVPPTELIQERNLNAEEVLIGIVLDIYNAPSDWVLGTYESGKLKYFTLGIKQVLKTTHNLKGGDIVKVVFRDFGGLMPLGPAPVRVNKRELIKIYANMITLGENVLKPAIAGHSIEHLESIS